MMRAEDLICLLRRDFSFDIDDFAALKAYCEFRDPFQVLIMTILTQNTSDRNAIKAFNALKSKFKIKPEVLASASLDEIADAIKFSGMQHRRSRVIRAVSKFILDRLNGDLRSVFKLPLRDARNLLISMPGIGRKTADVILLMVGGMPTFPVDRHVERVSKRLGLVSMDADYEEIRSTLMSIFRPEDYLEAHLLLITLGRKYCRARKPLCSNCPVKKFCDYFLSV